MGDEKANEVSTSSLASRNYYTVDGIMHGCRECLGRNDALHILCWVGDGTLT